MNRRSFLALGAASLGASALAGCNSQGSRIARPLLRFAERENREVEQWLFSHRVMDSPSPEAALAGRAMPAYFISERVPVWDPAVRGQWTLAVDGLVRRPLRLSLADLVRMRAITQRVDHYCVEGWTAVVVFTGVRVSELARQAGVLPAAGYVDFASFDDGFHESWDMASAMHPQTLIVYARAGRYLSPAYGAPARLHSPIKLGYKSTKYLTRVSFLARNPGGYWSDQGYEWYAGT